MSVSLATLLVLSLLALCSAQTPHFLDCPENDAHWGLFRRCCRHDSLPKGCECFDVSSTSGFTNTMYHKPQCPCRLESRFTLFTRTNRDSGVEIKAGVWKLSVTPFNGAEKTVFITHGFTDVGDALWMHQIKDALLDLEDFNLIILDWEEAAKAPNYYEAAANTRTVGAMVGWLIYDMHHFFGSPLDNFHLVGHSLGSHIMGYAGKEIYRLTGELLGRITGLDPAGPAFEDQPPHVRLDKSDAKFVDIIHTDGEKLLSSGFGTKKSIGQVDFYANGGVHQPGCPEETLGILSMLKFEDEVRAGACSHGRAIYYFLYSIARCTYDSPKRGSTCVMGYHAKPSCKGDYYPVTTSEEPYC